MNHDLSPPLTRLALLEGLLDPFYAVDAQWRYTYVNAHAARLMGVPREALLGRVLWDLFPEGKKSRLYVEYQRVMHAREVRQFEMYFPDIGVWEEVQAFPIEEGIGVHFRDITPRKRAEARREHLLDLTSRLTRATTEPEVVDTALATALAALGAKGGALLRPHGTELRPVRSFGEGGDATPWPAVRLDEDTPVTRAFRESAWVDLGALELSGTPWVDGGTRLLSVVPLVASDRPLGLLALTFDHDQPLGADEHAFAVTLAGQLAQALERIRLASADQLHARRQQFLAHAGELLAGSLDLGSTLHTLTELAVPELGDWCAVYLPDGETLKAHAVTHVDPHRVDQLLSVLRRVPITVDARGGAAEVLRSGAPLLLPEVTPAVLEAMERDPDQARMIRDLNLRSYLGVPMRAHGRVIGVLSFAYAESDRRYSTDDLTIALDLARRAALALDHARLYGEAQQWGATLERTVEDRTRELTARTRAIEAFAVLTHDLAGEHDKLGLIRRAQEILLTLLPDGLCGYFEPEGDRWMPRSLVGGPPDPMFDHAVRQGLRRGQARSFDVPFETREALYMDAWLPNPQHVPSEALARLHSAAAFPVGVGGPPQGVLMIALYAQHAWTPEDRVLLDTAVAQLTLALQRAEARLSLEQRTRELEELNRELEAYSYTISHDLRAPVRHILGFSGLLRRALGNGMPDSAARSLSLIEMAASRMNLLIEALLEFAQTSRRPLEMGQVDLGAVVVDAINDLHLDLSGRQVRWSVGTLPVVRGDEVLLRQVLVNLLSNAVKYSAGRDVAQVEVSSEEHPSEVVVHVRDNGVGFDPKFSVRLFGVLQRLHRADEFEGTGIGLATVRRIVQRHGGRVWADARPGEGATFSFALPR